MIPTKAQPLFIALITAASLLLAATGRAQEDYPLRPYYPEVPYMTTDRLMNEYDSTIVVDIRSRFEYEVARINKAILLPLTGKDFAQRLEEIRPKQSEQSLIFYCNGHSCAKSYQAAQLSLSMGFENVFVYDGGIFDWIMAAPDKATLMGSTPARADRVISKEALNRRMMTYEQFENEARKPNTIVIDIRDPFQRDLTPRIDGIRNIPLDPLLELVTSRIWTEKRLLFFDAVGKQVRWLQYFLESFDYFDYAFLDGGIRSIADSASKLKPVIESDRSVVSSQAMLLKLTADQRLNNSDRKVISYLLANIKFNNYVVIDMERLSLETGINDSLLLSSMKKLTSFGYATHSVIQGMLIVQVDPRLAWKGDNDSALWEEKVHEFETSILK
ncbi:MULTISPECIES: rhodanese-like domain-containing protein [unclassified Pseudodesulfovibrio]|uniref:rhodanese-like domain-containing protein n=1 Tax=unclassified Pseudodesulfovibrio TaxID=2661612 RepID=UPI000FEBE64C|nr:MULTISPECIES: rhodanese-like domain-containing protein [unclassified Pseudodesulfovibrio]MCJ2164830.1 rhodanese-like domain-containing protein [Pseudodesulfovibrio sp. S3-i]RWU03801.1 rhodanese-like domain-containing protein [Pseudodesulfovibrio sp. S3]